MNKKLIDFQRNCEINSFPVIHGETMVCLLNNKYLYSDDETYTIEELFNINEENKLNDVDRSALEMDWCDYEECDSPNTDLTLEEIEYMGEILVI